MTRQPRKWLLYRGRGADETDSTVDCQRISCLPSHRDNAGCIQRELHAIAGQSLDLLRGILILGADRVGGSELFCHLKAGIVDINGNDGCRSGCSCRHDRCGTDSSSAKDCYGIAGAHAKRIENRASTSGQTAAERPEQLKRNISSTLTTLRADTLV